MTEKERAVEDMDTDTVFGLNRRGYGHRYIEEGRWKSKLPYYGALRLYY